MFYRHGAGAARGAHNPEVTRSKRVAGIIPLRLFLEATCLTDGHKTVVTLYRHGAGAAREAHNLEVTRSKRVAGIHYNLLFVWYLSNI